MCWPRTFSLDSLFSCDNHNERMALLNIFTLLNKNTLYRLSACWRSFKATRGTLQNVGVNICTKVNRKMTWGSPSLWIVSFFFFKWQSAYRLSDAHYTKNDKGCSEMIRSLEFTMEPRMPENVWFSCIWIDKGNKVWNNSLTGFIYKKNEAC